MEKLLTSALIGLALAGTASADSKQVYKSETNVVRAADGSVDTENEVESTDTSGTKRKSEFKQEARTDSRGETKVLSTSKSVTDPKGLGNKTWSDQKVTSKTDARGNLNREISGKAVDSQGTSHSVDIEREVKVRPDGSTKTTVSEERVENPKGLMNQSKTDIETTVAKDAKGNVVKTIKKVDGKTVEERDGSQ